MATRDRIKRTRREGPGTIAAVFLVACLVASPLMAQIHAGDQAPSPVAAESFSLHKERTAFTLSLTGALASWGLLLISSAGATEDAPSEFASAMGFVAVVGIMVGPSLGCFSGGCWGRGLLMTGLRVGVSVAAVAYFLEHDEADNTAAGVIWLGALIGSAIYECATVKSAVRKHNAARLAKRNMKLALAPIALRRGAGLSVQLSF